MVRCFHGNMVNRNYEMGMNDGFLRRWKMKCSIWPCMHASRASRECQQQTEHKKHKCHQHIIPLGSSFGLCYSQHNNQEERHHVLLKIGLLRVFLSWVTLQYLFQLPYWPCSPSVEKSPLGISSSKNNLKWCQKISHCRDICTSSNRGNDKNRVPKMGIIK